VYPKREWPALVWCVPALAGFVLLLFSFPLEHKIAFWPHLSRAQLFMLWFLFVTPLTTTMAIAVLMQSKRSPLSNCLIRILAWVAIVLSVLVNAFVLVGMWESTN